MKLKILLSFYMTYFLNRCDTKRKIVYLIYFCFKIFILLFDIKLNMLIWINDNFLHYILFILINIMKVWCLLKL